MSRADLPVDDVVRRYTAGESLRELAADYQVATGTVRARLLDAGVRLRRRGAARLDVDLAELVYETHLAGSRRAAARTLGLGRATASRRLAELSINHGTADDRWSRAPARTFQVLGGPASSP